MHVVDLTSGSEIARVQLPRNVVRAAARLPSEIAIMTGEGDFAMLSVSDAPPWTIIERPLSGFFEVTVVEGGELFTLIHGHEVDGNVLVHQAGIPDTMIPLGESGYAMARGPDRVYVSGQDKVFEIDATSHSIVGTYPTTDCRMDRLAAFGDSYLVGNCSERARLIDKSNGSFSSLGEVSFVAAPGEGIRGLVTGTASSGVYELFAGFIGEGTPDALFPDAAFVGTSYAFALTASSLVRFDLVTGDTQTLAPVVSDYYYSPVRLAAIDASHVVAAVGLASRRKARFAVFDTSGEPVIDWTELTPP